MKWLANLLGRESGEPASKTVATLKKISTDVYEYDRWGDGQ